MYDGYPSIDDTRKRPIRPGDLPTIPVRPTDDTANLPPVDAATVTNTTTALPPIGTVPASLGMAPVIGPDAVASDASATSGLPQIGAIPTPETPATATTATPTPAVAPAGEQDPISAQGLATIANDVKMATPMQDQLASDISTYRSLKEKNETHIDPATGQRVPNKHSVWSRIAAAAMGWAKGGLIGGIEAARDPHYFEGQRTDRDQRELLPTIAADEKAAQIEQQGNTANLRAAATMDTLKARALAAKQRFQDRLSLLQQQNKEQTPWEAPDGKMYWIDKTGKKFAMTERDVSGNDIQMVNPDKTYYDALSPVTNTPVRIRGNQLYSGEATIAAGNATRTQSAEEANRQATMEVDRRNADRANTWAQNTHAQINQVIAAQGALAGQVPGLNNIPVQFGVLETELNALNPKDVDVDKKRDAIMKRYDTLMKESSATLGKSAAGLQVLQALQQNMPPKPTFESRPVPVAASTITLKKGIIPYSTVVEQAKKKGVSPAKAKKDAEDAGFIVQ